jgi:hypothetical protein
LSLKMTNRLELNWKVDGFVDEQRYYCSETPIDPENLPPPKAVLAGDERIYVDTDIVLGMTYYIRVAAIKNGVSKISEEVTRVAGESWEPDLLNSLRSWLVADNPENTLINGKLSIIADKSGHSANAEPFEGSDSNSAEMIKSSLNGRDVWRCSNTGFKGVFDIQDKTISKGASEITLAVVSKINSDIGNADANIFRINTGVGVIARAMIGRGYYVSNGVYAGGRRLDTDPFVGLNNNQNLGTDWLIVIGIFDFLNATLSLSVNGERYELPTFHTAGHISNTTPYSISIGHSGTGVSGSIGVGDYAEAIILDSGLNHDQLDKLEGYLAWQWGLQSSLPANHAFKNIRPLV